MRWLVLSIFSAALAWSAFWFVGKTMRHAALEEWFADRNTAGWVAHSDIQLRGYPNRFDAVLGDIDLANPKNGWAWAAPHFQILQLSYQPNHIIALWPETQTLSTPKEQITINSSDMRASAVFDDPKTLVINRATLTAEKLRLVSNQNWTTTADNIQLSLRQSPNAEARYDLALTTDALQPKSLQKINLGNGAILPNSFDTFNLRAVLEFSAPLSKQSFESGTSYLKRITLEDVDFKWGDLELRAAGTLALDTHGYPTGTLTIRAVNWEKMVELAGAHGAISTEMTDALNSALSLLSTFSGRLNTLDIPLNFSRQKIRIGPVAIGKAPKIRFP
ncbi:hypothetical protein GCM10007939_23710 [Amylibacter marinus]|uniref:DUF2125 domain-containing protein n=1 Tax=Amylibacter marinus TaxID=1475483 RepID=A0ABQ5VXD4_9RHOB|nr:DUF2125 domain-containing protein [Amylibacter marinus]GLQ36087.1 hypothetical protein GCM10007939_23710 [Amylibacter marinus]